jgi:hypothetical protein
MIAPDWDGTSKIILQIIDGCVLLQQVALITHHDLLTAHFLRDYCDSKTKNL